MLRQSKFVICPRGVGTSSIRLFECLRAGRVPIIVAISGLNRKALTGPVARSASQSVMSLVFPNLPRNWKVDGRRCLPPEPPGMCGQGFSMTLYSSTKSVTDSPLCWPVEVARKRLPNEFLPSHSALNSSI